MKPQVFKEFVNVCISNGIHELNEIKTSTDPIDELEDSLEKLSVLCLPAGSLIILNGRYLNALVSKISDSEKSIRIGKVVKIIRELMSE